jgi:hypothetical protein
MKNTDGRQENRIEEHKSCFTENYLVFGLDEHP